MITLESIDITGLIVADDFTTNVFGVTQRANDGSLIVYEQENKYKDIILIGGSDWGWLTRSIMNQLHALANGISVSYELDYEGVLSTVRFKSEDIPVISGTPLIKRSNKEDADYYNDIVLKLMQV